MLKGLVRLAACAASGASFLALTGCGGAAPGDWPSAPPPSAYEDSGARPELAGAPAYRADDDLMGGPARDASDIAPASPAAAPWGSPGLTNYRRDDGLLVTAMRPVPNPEDLSVAERRRVYGARYAPRAYTQASPRRAYRQAPVAEPRPIARPAPRAVAKAPVAPRAVAPKPVAKAAPPPAPVAPVAKAPAPAPAAKPVPIDPLGALRAAVQGEATRGSTLTIPDALEKGQPAQVSLTLPQTLLEAIQREAAKLGLGKPARKAEVTATLSGQGYEITPNGAQSAKLKPGEAAKFDWQVTPGAGPKAPLKAEVEAALTGQGKAKTFPLVTVEQAVKPPPAPAPVEARKGFSLPGLPKFALPGFDMPKVELPKVDLPKVGGLDKLRDFKLSMLAIPGMKEIDLPGLGKVPSQNVVLGAIIALLLALMIMASRAAGERRRRAERRRKFRTMTDYGRVDADPEPEHGYVNPMLAAAGGAIGGAALAHAADDHAQEAPAAHDDHGHHHEAPAAHEEAHDDDDGHAAHDDHGHDDHGHETHAEAADHRHHEPEHA